MFFSCQTYHTLGQNFINQQVCDCQGIIHKKLQRLLGYRSDGQKTQQCSDFLSHSQEIDPGNQQLPNQKYLVLVLVRWGLSVTV